MAILTLLLVMMASVVNQTSSMWSTTRGKIEQFRDARDGFEAMTRRISQATLNTYWDYQDASGNTRTAGTTGNSATFTPVRYARQSELRFISGPSASLITPADTRPTHAIFFQAPLGVVADSSGSYSGLQYLLNTWGYYIEYANDKDSYPPFVHVKEWGHEGRNRFRLMELIQPSEQMTLYTYTSGSATYNGQQWYMDALNYATPPVHVLAENIVALVIQPKLTPADEAATGATLTSDYLYDSTVKKSDATINPKNQLPPVVQVTMVAIDEASARRMTDADNTALQTRLGTLFTDSTSFDSNLKRDAVKYLDVKGDPSLEAYFISRKLSYRIFTTNVSIKGAKWSRAQSK